VNNLQALSGRARNWFFFPPWPGLSRPFTFSFVVIVRAGGRSSMVERWKSKLKVMGYWMPTFAGMARRIEPQTVAV
jgi:hypothetical protein